MHERQLALALSSERVIALTSLDFNVRYKIGLSAMQNFLLLKHALSFIQGKTGQSRVLKARDGSH